VKNKLRKITVDNSKYLYVISDQYYADNKNNILTLKIFLSGKKNTPLIIDFLTLDNFHIGQVLKSGIDLQNKKINTIDRVNINEPKYVRELILQGLRNGWTGNNKIEIQNGMHYLNELGYETTSLDPKENNLSEN
jgi:hypothetical protein